MTTFQRALGSGALAFLGLFLSPSQLLANSCDTSDGALGNAAFVIVTKPIAGARLSRGFQVKGCSSTFENNVVWRLLARNGDILAKGFTRGGGVEGPAPFAFSVEYSIADRQIGHLEVFEEDVSQGEGFPPGKTVLPVVLQP